MKQTPVPHPLGWSGWTAMRAYCLPGALVAGMLALVFALPSYAQTNDSSLNFSGDFRLRYENTSNQIPGSAPTELNDARNRGVVRLRAGITKNINDLIDFGARLATGSGDDPNTADATMGQFVNDFEVNLDRIFVGLSVDNFKFSGGKFANPFLRTDLVWDGDVNPQGIAGSYSFQGSGAATAKLVALYYIVDELAFGADSDMLGAQLQVNVPTGSGLNLTLAGGYYDYTIRSLIDADAGDTRSNFLNEAGTAYMSDFDLLDFIAILDYPGSNPRFPIRFVGDFVKNFGADSDEDIGFMFDLFVGRTSNVRDVRFNYGYSQSEQDAFLAAFSNDNTTLASNYQQHTFTIDYVPLNNTVLNLTWYLFRLNKLPPGAVAGADEFTSRLRLNAVISF